MTTGKGSLRKLSCLWAKTDASDHSRYHPLLLHLLDVAACAENILNREPKTTRERMASILGLPWEEAKPWLQTLIASHDLGKACPGFQLKWECSAELLAKEGIKAPGSPDTRVNHAFVSQVALESLLVEQGWSEGLAELVADAVGCHHGTRASPNTLSLLRGSQRALGGPEWELLRAELFNALLQVFGPAQLPLKQKLSGPDFMLLAGLTSFADWIGSNELWFDFGSPENCEGMKQWYHAKLEVADKALDAIGWEYRTPLGAEYQSFKQVFGFNPRPLQSCFAEILGQVEGPTIVLVEAPMGEGKTEAAFFAHRELQRRFDHRGLYVALPTKATGNAMFFRALNFLKKQGMDRSLDLQLVHGAAYLNDKFRELRLRGIHDQESGAEIRAGEWFTSKKRALLSEYGVGTVDQAILPILPVRHNFVRLWGLANRVIIFDEIHAYDAYTGSLLVYLLLWLRALGSSIILLSATLPPSIRRKMAEISGNKLPSAEAAYPRITVFDPARIEQRHFAADPTRRLKISVLGVDPDISSLKATLDRELSGGGYGLALVNTVQRAQELFQRYTDGVEIRRDGQSVGMRTTDGTEIFLFHARYPAQCRQARENAALSVFGEQGKREGKKILIATQVAEQSLDLDFDFIVTDLAPIDLVLQRAGRLWRHERGGRILPEAKLCIAGLSDIEPPSFGAPLWWGSVYREDLLLRTWIYLHERRDIVLPDEIDEAVRVVYEGEESVSDNLVERLERATMESLGKSYAEAGQADQAIIGFPDDASWNEPGRFVLCDEDAPGVHKTLLAQTRLGEDSVTVVPVFAGEGFDWTKVPDRENEKKFYLNSVSLSGKRYACKLIPIGVPEGWRKSPLLHNCYALELDADGRWLLDPRLRLDENLGFVYEAEEDA